MVRQPLPHPRRADSRRRGRRGRGGARRRRARRWSPSGATGRRRSRRSRWRRGSTASTPRSGSTPTRRRTASTRSSTSSTPRASSPSARPGSTTTTTTRPATSSRRAFAAQIQLAHERRLPLVIHTRDAWDDTFDILARRGHPRAHDLPLLHRRPRRGAALPRPRRLPVVLRHRHVQGRARGPGGGPALPARPDAGRDRQPVPRAGAPPRQAEPAGLGRPRRPIHRRSPRCLDADVIADATSANAAVLFGL